MIFIDVDGGWTDWGACSATSGECIQERTCTNPEKVGNGADCDGDATQPCGDDDCPGRYPSYRGFMSIINIYIYIKNLQIFCTNKMFK